MPYLSIDGAELFYEEVGDGPRPIVFLHGVGMSRRYFARQMEFFGKAGSGYRVIAPDFRAHGRSPVVHSGHTVPQYARDLRALLEGLGIAEGVKVVGWSLGALVLWDYVAQFGLASIGAAVVVDTGASDFRWDDYPHAGMDFDALRQAMRAVQEDYELYADVMLDELFRTKPAPEDLEWMRAGLLAVPPSVTSAILFDLVVQDYRPVVSRAVFPILLCFGRDEKMTPVSAAEDLLGRLPDARLSVFEQSGHCPFWEEPDRFNDETVGFLAR